MPSSWSDPPPHTSSTPPVISLKLLLNFYYHYYFHYHYYYYYYYTPHARRAHRLRLWIVDLSGGIIIGTTICWGISIFVSRSIGRISIRLSTSFIDRTVRMAATSSATWYRAGARPALRLFSIFLLSQSFSFSFSKLLLLLLLLSSLLLLLLLFLLLVVVVVVVL